MSGSMTDASALPASHIFVTAAYGHRQKTVAVPRWAATAAAAALVLAALWGFGCTLYVLGHDSLLAAAMRHERDLQDGFEDRIATLRRDLDRATTQGAQLERSVGTQLDALSVQEADLRRRAETVATLAKDVLRMAAVAGTSARQAAAGPVADPQAEALRSEARTRADEAPTRLPSQTPVSRAVGDKLSALAARFSTIAGEQERQLAGLQAAATGRLAAFRGALDQAGLNLARYGHAGGAAGGPFVPLPPDAAASGFERASLKLQGVIAEAAHLQAAVAHTPFDKPLGGDPEITSPFGVRIDPFLGRPALHTGLDLKEDTGTAVLATAPGRVTVAGPASGYGTLVEIDHGNGLSTRYGHLSAVEVEVGQAVGTGTVVGRVGATGRATGPHLHYETRIDGQPVDPMRFLQAGHLLAEAGAR